MSLEQSQPTTGTQRITSANDIAKAGRPDGTEALRGRGAGSTSYFEGTSVNDTQRAGRPDVNHAAINRSFEQITDDGLGGITDVSAGRVVQSKEY